jgi:hypothetical protein
MRSIFVFSVVLALMMSSREKAIFAADTQPARQDTWENTVAAANKEGRLNFYVGRLWQRTIAK